MQKSNFPKRKRIRLRDFHYGGVCAYYVTICTHQKRHLFGRCIYGRMHLSWIGQIVEEQWAATALMRQDFIPDEHIVMPHHLHATFFLTSQEREKSPAPNKTLLARILSGFKSAVTSRVRKRLRAPDFEVWQAGSRDRVMRNDRELERARRYIRENPFRWSFGGPELPLIPV